MPLRTIRFRGALAAVFLIAMLVPSAAPATVASLRVLTPNATLEPGTSFVTGTERIKTDPHARCFTGGVGGSGDTATLAGPTAMGLLKSGLRTNTALRPLSVTDEFGFGLGLCGIGGKKGNANRYWSLLVNHKDPGVGGDQVRLHNGDEVVWYLTGFPPPPELDLRAPAGTAPGSFEVTVFEHACTTNPNPPYDTTCNRVPAAGATVDGGSGGPVTTNNAGVATLSEPGPLLLTLQASLSSDIPSAPVDVCVNSSPALCPDKHGKRIVGRPADDRFAGTSGWDSIAARSGDDVVDIGQGGHDVVNCGGGHDKVLGAGANDMIRSSCEVVRP